MTNHPCSTLTPADAMYALDLTPVDIVRSTGLSMGSVRRATLGSGKRINVKTAQLIANALGMPIDEIEWPGPLTSAGRTPLTGGNYTIGAGSRATLPSDGQRGLDINWEDLPLPRRKNPELESKFCDQHHLELPLSGICDICVA